VIEEGPRTRSVALVGDDTPWLRPAFHVDVGDRVELGQVLVTDRSRPELRLASPASGAIKSIERTEMRRLAALVIEVKGEGERRFRAFAADELVQLPGAEVATHLLEAGHWIALRTRPFGNVADASAPPDALFVRAMDTNPLAARAGLVIAERPDDLRFGLIGLSRLTEGPVFFCTELGAPPIAGLGLPGVVEEQVRVVAFEGPHPAGLPGTHIHHLLPRRAGRRAWYVGYQDVLAIGHQLRTGRWSPERVIALGGPRVRRPRLLRTRLGASTEDLVRGELESPESRIISGSVLSGRLAASRGSYLGRYHEQVCVIPGGPSPRRGRWPVPAGRRTRWVPPWLGRPEWTGDLHGSKRAMLPIHGFERVVPLRLHVSMLLRALAVGDSEEALRLGALELEEEDLALCTYLCPSKLEYGSLLRTALRELEKRQP